MKNVKMQQINKCLGGSDINAMFSEMLGLKDADPNIIIPKLVNIKNILLKIHKTINLFYDILITDFLCYSTELHEVKQYSNSLLEICKLEEDVSDNYVNISKEEINKLYKNITTSSIIKNVIVLCANLKRYYPNFDNNATFKINFINSEPGLEFKLLSFTSLDFKLLWNHENMSESKKRFILSILKNIYEKAYEIYTISTSPNIDLEEFTSVVIHGISELKKHPQLCRCKNAFKRIESSIDLLKSNFSSYYRDSIASENPSLLIMNFILDVSNQGGSNSNLTREFRELIIFMNKTLEARGKMNNPEIKKIFSILNNNFTLMEKNDTEQNPSNNPEPVCDSGEIFDATEDDTESSPNMQIKYNKKKTKN